MRSDGRYGARVGRRRRPKWAFFRRVPSPCFGARSVLKVGEQVVRSLTDDFVFIEVGRQRHGCGRRRAQRVGGRAPGSRTKSRNFDFPHESKVAQRQKWGEIHEGGFPVSATRGATRQLKNSVHALSADFAQQLGRGGL